MTCENHTHFDWNNIIRTAAIAAVTLPISIALTNNISTNTDLARQNIVDVKESTKVLEEHKDALTKACIDFRLSDVDSKLEKQAEIAISEFFDGEVNEAAVCRWILG